MSFLYRDLRGYCANNSSWAIEQVIPTISAINSHGYKETRRLSNKRFSIQSFGDKGILHSNSSLALCTIHQSYGVYVRRGNAHYGVFNGHYKCQVKRLVRDGDCFRFLDSISCL